MPSILQGGPKPAPMPPPMPMTDPGQDQGAPGTLVASIYEKPDGTYCTEGPDGAITEHPDIDSAVDDVKQMAGGGMEDEGAEPDEHASSQTEGSDY